MSSNSPTRDKLLLDLIYRASEVTMSLSRALNYGMDFNSRVPVSPSENILKNISEFNQVSEKLINQLPRPPIPYMVKAILEDFKNFSDREKEEFITTQFNNLNFFMPSLGVGIIEHFSLWAFPWRPQIVDGLDVSPNHPDNLALTVIEAVWRNLQDA
jgi:hypothetical protein